MIGISAYFQDLDFEYLEKAVSLNITHIFTSVQVIEENYQNIDEKLSMILEFSKTHKIILIPDIAPRTLEKLSITRIEQLKDMGFQAIRVDGGYDTVEEMKSLVSTFEVYLNASDVRPSFIKELEQAGCEMNRISVMHNFYPRIYTGLNKEHMIGINEEFRKYGVRIAAFVAGDYKLRGPVFEGLPTLEKHRGMHPYVACVELLMCGVDDVYIGDNQANIETLKMMVEYCHDKVMSLRVIIDNEYQELYEKKIAIRSDITDNIVRLAYGRGVFNQVTQQHTLQRNCGTITIDNDSSGRYVGEINICKVPLNSDGKINVIGHIYPEYLELLKLIDRDTIIKFVR